MKINLLTFCAFLLIPTALPAQLTNQAPSPFSLSQRLTLLPGTGQVQDFLQTYNTHPSRIKNSFVTKQKLDSETMEAFSQETDSWTPQTQSRYTYDQSGYMILKNQDMIDPVSGGWVNYIQTSYTYHSSGNISTLTTQEWDQATETWVNASRQENTFLNNGDILEYVEFFWKEELNEWFPMYRDTYSYNQSGYLTGDISYTWHGDLQTGDWQLNSKSEITYDEQGKTLMLIQDQYLSGAWIHEIKESYEYDNSGRIAALISWNWDADAGEWVPLFKMESSYSTCDYPSQVIFSNFFEEWMPMQKSNRSFDQSGRITQVLDYSWSFFTGEWVLQTQGDYEYDNRFQRADLLLPWEKNANYMFNYMLLGIHYQKVNQVTSQLEPSFRYLYHYSETDVSGIDASPITALVVYPNPASEYLIIESGESMESAHFELFDLNGRCVHSQKLTGLHTRISLPPLESGLYQWRIQHKDLVLTDKFLVH